MKTSLSTIRVLMNSFSDIGTAVRASREYTKLSREAPAANADRQTISNLLPR